MSLGGGSGSARLTAPPYRCVPGSHGLGQEAAQPVGVAGDAIVGVVPTHHARQPIVLFAYGRVPPPFHLLPQFLQLADHAAALRLAVHHESSVQGLAAVVREAQEVERFGAILAPSQTVRYSEPPELNQ